LQIKIPLICCLVVL